MVRMDGLSYAIDPTQTMGRRIRDIQIGSRPLEPSRCYKGTGWATWRTPKP